VMRLRPSGTTAAGTPPCGTATYRLSRPRSLRPVSRGFTPA
jgi:hypothetical protein